MGFRVSLLVLPAALVACAGVAPPAPVAAPAARVPAVPVLSLDRRAASLAELTRGRPALVALWATWCASCSRELGELDRLQGRVGGDALVVGIAVGEPFERVAAFLRPRRLGYAQLVDEDFKLADALGAKRVPTTLVIDRAGAVRYAGGELDPAALAAFRRAIAE
jgi:cytochrome c biogenesis protein CcmG/thiol:disulfide interchange protein DsbE